MSLRSLGNELYERLPERLQRLAKRMLYSRSATTIGKLPGEISWQAFADTVLAKREQYRGVFIQEPVIPYRVDLYQRPQHVAVALGRSGYLVIYRTFQDGVRGVLEVAKNVWITPRMEAEDVTDAVHSFYSTAPNYPGAVRNARRHARAVVYEYIDHIDPKISGGPRKIERLLALRDAALRGEFDYVVCSAGSLYREMADRLDPGHVLLIPNGVDAEHYRSADHAGHALPVELLAFRTRYQTIVGFFGAIAPWLWYEVIQQLCLLRPGLGFLFIGPDYYGGTDSLPREGNFLHIGAVDYRVLPAYARLFDVGFLPFEPGDIARTTSPLKLFEYFALEIPVVCTADMLECTRYAEVLCGDSAATLGAALDRAIALKDDPEYRRKLRQLADDNDWKIRVKAFEPLFGGQSPA